MNSKETQYYIYNGNTYTNMKDCRESIGDGISSKAFKHMLKYGIVQRITNQIDVNNDTKNSQEYGKRK